MRRPFWTLVPAILLLVGACLPTSAMERDAPRIPKGTPLPGSSDPGLMLTRAPTPTARGLGRVGDIVPRSWPQPFTYGPKFPPPTDIPAPVQPIPLPDDTVNILLLGSDRRPDWTSFRTDTIILLSLQPSNRGAVLLSIPRDLYVYLPGYNMQRINAALILGESYKYPGGGLAMLYDAIQYNLGLTVHGHARVEMSGFIDAIDTLGGIDVNVACSYTDWRLKEPGLDQQDEDNWELFTVPAGVVNMDGDYALWYARSRKRSSDFDRSRRQQEVLRAVFRESLRLDLIPRLPELYGDLSSSVSTDLSLADMIRLSPMATRISSAQIRSRFIGRDQVTSWTTPTGGAVQLPKPLEIRQLLLEAFNFETPSQVLPEDPVTIEVRNASGRDDWGILAAERLIYAGYEAYAGPDMESIEARSSLHDFGNLDSAIVDDVLRTLGLPSSALVSNPDPSSPFDVQLILGADYSPCFNPTRNQ